MKLYASDEGLNEKPEYAPEDLVPKAALDYHEALVNHNVVGQLWSERAYLLAIQLTAPEDLLSDNGETADRWLGFAADKYHEITGEEFKLVEGITPAELYRFTSRCFGEAKRAPRWRTDAAFLAAILDKDEQMQFVPYPKMSNS